MRLFDEGLQVNEIAKRLKVHRNRVASLIKKHQADAGLPPTDLTKRRGEIQKREDRALHKQIANRVMELYRQGRSYKEICKECRCSHPIVMRAIRYWHELRDLPVPDGRTRRKTLPRNQTRQSETPSNDALEPKRNPC